MNPIHQLPEDFLHYIWQFRLFDQVELTTTDGETLEILQLGSINRHAGPDFSDARIKIGQTLWAGHIEIHKKSSDWLQHKHQDDAAYDNVILHVVYEYDREVYRQDGSVIPTLALEGKIPRHYIQQYWLLLQNKDWIPCQKQFAKVLENPLRLTSWLDRLIIDRLEQKTQPIRELLAQNQQHWEQTFYQFLARSFGSKVNAEPFEQLAQITPLKILAKHKNNLHQLEALLFGQAGLLDEDFTDDYPQQLKKEYQFLRQKYNLTPLKAASWKFARMRPANFPTIRIAQFAKLVHQSSHLFSKVLAANDVKSLSALFKVKLGDYWLRHYQFDKESPKRNKSLGKTALDLLIINTFVPFLFVYAKSKDDLRYQDKALAWLRELPAERNSIIRQWKKLGVEVKSAQDSQALLQLKNAFCQQKRCLSCAVGDFIIKSTNRPI